MARGQGHRRWIERSGASGAIFFARSYGDWSLSGAAVDIRFVGQDDGSQVDRQLDGQPGFAINPDHTFGTNLTTARRLRENASTAFMGDIKVGPFDIDESTARLLLAKPNPDGRSNANVVRPWVNGLDLTRRPRNMYIIDFGLDMSEQEAALYEGPFEYALREVRPIRKTNVAACCRDRWWIHHNARPEMRRALHGLRRYLATPRLTKHRLFVWLDAQVLPDSQVIVIARDDDYTFGILHSRVHELWARATGTQLREVESGFRYTPTTCFETFPFPDPTSEQSDRVGEAARRLAELRQLGRANV